MEFLADPIRKFKTHFPKLLPYGIGLIIGFLGIAKLLAFLLERYENPSICLFIGLIGGMLPSLFREAGEKGRNWKSFVSLFLAAIAVFALLISLKIFSVNITPNFLWYIFCGFCLALSVIAPGMSFSTLLMPLGLYTPFIDGISSFKLEVIIPAGIGAVVTIILFAKAMDLLFKKFHSVAFHAIIGVVIAATAMIIPFESFTTSLTSGLTNTICLCVGIVVALLLDNFNQKFEK